MLVVIQAAFAKGDHQACSRLLSALKVGCPRQSLAHGADLFGSLPVLIPQIALTTFPALPPRHLDSPSAQQELLLAREDRVELPGALESMGRTLTVSQHPRR